MRICIVNDDGINAFGLYKLYHLAKEISDEVFIIAPEKNCSGIGRAISLHKFLQVQQLKEDRFYVAGTPADCVILSIFAFEKKPDLILSGINNGWNLACDLTQSGTVGAIMQACYHGIPGIALSMQDDRWDVIENYGISTINFLLKMMKDAEFAQEHGSKKHQWWNLNFPKCSTVENKSGQTEIKISHQGQFHYRDKAANHFVDIFGREGYFIGNIKRHFNHDDVNSDIVNVNNGYISVMPLDLSIEYKGSH